MSELANSGHDGTTMSPSVARSPEIVSPRLERMNLDSANIPIEMRAWRQMWKNGHANSCALKTKIVATGKSTTKIGEQFFREAVSYSDAIHIIPLVSCLEE